MVVAVGKVMSERHSGVSSAASAWVMFGAMFMSCSWSGLFPVMSVIISVSSLRIALCRWLR